MPVLGSPVPGAYCAAPAKSQHCLLPPLAAGFVIALTVGTLVCAATAQTGALHILSATAAPRVAPLPSRETRRSAAAGAPIHAETPPAVLRSNPGAAVPPVLGSQALPSPSLAGAAAGVIGIFATVAIAVGLRAPQGPSVALLATSGDKAAPSGDIELDTEAVVRYFGATALQWGLIVLTLGLLDQAVGAIGASGAEAWVPQAVIAVFFFFTAVRSRVFSPLDNSRPNLQSDKQAINGLQRPSWMPPPLTFPIVWSIIALLRTASGYLIWEAAGQTLLTVPTVLYFLHLCCGDTWNTINNVEKRPGAAVIGVGVVWLTSLIAVIANYNALPLAGKVLLPQSLWLTVASILIFDIWRINGAEPLYPYRTRE